MNEFSFVLVSISALLYVLQRSKHVQGERYFLSPIITNFWICFQHHILIVAHGLFWLSSYDILKKSCDFIGAEVLVQHLHSHNVPIAIATGSSQSSYAVKISKKGDLFDGISHAVCSDDPDVKEGKPSPYIYQVAAARFEDAPKSNSNVSMPNAQW